MNAKCLLQTKIYFFILLLIWSHSSAQSVATLDGYILDASTGEGLAGANIQILGTGLGSSSNIYGKYSIGKIPFGSYTVRVTYIGYEPIEKTVLLQSKYQQINFKLDYKIIEGSPIIVTAQAEGQMKAINQQLSAKAIVNVVSSARIEELPDANAAESVGRLPGVSILREGGEGNKVVIRGLSPKYNLVTVDGVRMTSTDFDDRSTDLSMILPNMLDGIEVMKAITPDQDADVLGGVVNFKMKESKEVAERKKAGINFELQIQGGYNDLKNTYNDYKYAGLASTRLLNNRLGMLVQASVEKRNRSSNELGASYMINERELGIKNPTFLTDLNLSDITRNRLRFGGALAADYHFPKGKINFNNFFSFSDTELLNRSESYNLDLDRHYYSTTDTQSKLNLMTNVLSYEHSFYLLKINTKISHALSENKSPDNLNFNFFQQAVGLSRADPKLNPTRIPSFAIDDPMKTSLSSISEFERYAKEREITAALDFEINFNISNRITNKIIFGGKYRHKDRSFDHNAAGGTFNSGGAQNVRQAILDAFPWMKETISSGNSNLPIALFIDPDYEFETFLGGDYTMGPAVDIELMHQVHEVARPAGKGDASYFSNDFSSNTNDYSGNDYVSAAYIMTELNIGQKVRLIPGVRYEHIKTSYTGARGNSSFTGSYYHYNHFDTTITRTHGFWLPMIHLRYKPLTWFDVRFAYTNTLTYPDFRTIIPRIDVGLQTVYWNNPDLKPAQSENFDLYFSFYSNHIGLFTVGGFMKRIEALIFPSSDRRIIDAGKYEGIEKVEEGKMITTHINNHYDVDVKGLEIDWQTHFWYLPGLFKGLVLNANYTHIFSQAKYPRSIFEVTHLFESPWVIVKNIDNFYTNRMINQPDDILNLAIGYDYKCFSIRISMLYQDEVFIEENFWPELRQITDDYLRWDLSIKQDLPWYGLQMYGQINNIFNERDTNLIQGSLFPASEQHYGITVDLGIRLRL